MSVCINESRFPSGDDVLPRTSRRIATFVRALICLTCFASIGVLLAWRG
jgi:hypothetical protein